MDWNVLAESMWIVVFAVLGPAPNFVDVWGDSLWLMSIDETHQ